MLDFQVRYCTCRSDVFLAGQTSDLPIRHQTCLLDWPWKFLTTILPVTFWLKLFGKDMDWPFRWLWNFDCCRQRSFLQSVVCWAHRWSTCHLRFFNWLLDHIYLMLKEKVTAVISWVKKVVILSENSCHFVSCSAFNNSNYFLSLRWITWSKS